MSESLPTEGIDALTYAMQKLRKQAADPHHVYAISGEGAELLLAHINQLEHDLHDARSPGEPSGIPSIREWLHDYASMLQLTISQPTISPKLWEIANTRFSEVVQYLNSPHEPGGDERAFAWGWRLCANWAKRDDLIADIGSPTYLADMRSALTKGVVQS